MEKIKAVESKLEDDAIDCFNKLYNITNENRGNLNKKEISLEKIAFFLTLYGEKIPQEYKDIILQYNLVHNIMENKIKNGVNDDIFTENIFKDFLSGKELKDTLFNSTLTEKKDKIELLTKLFYVFGGNANGISREKLFQAINSFYRILNLETENGELIKMQTEEILELLSDNEKNISLNDFTNIMTSELNFDDIPIEEIIGDSPKRLVNNKEMGNSKKEGILIQTNKQKEYKNVGIAIGEEYNTNSGGKN